MALRSWAIRGLILTGVAGVAGLGWVAHSWVSPERVKAQVLAHLAAQFPGAEVSVADARVRLFGGIAVSDIRVTRAGDADPFLVVPAAVLHHDKQQLTRGKLVIRKVELENPEVRLDRGPDGRWNVEGAVRVGEPNEPVPTFVVKGATVRVTDRGPDPLPPLTLTGAEATVLNDPSTVLTVRAKATAAGYGPVAAVGKLVRTTGKLDVVLQLPEFPLGGAAPAVAARVAPDLAPHLAGLSATASVTADLSYAADARRWGYTLTLDLKGARFTHPDLPWPVEAITASVGVKDGRATVKDATARVNGADVRVSLETRKDPAGGGPEDFLESAEVTVTGVALDDALFAHLPEKARALRQAFSPAGRVDAGYRFTRDAGGWRREFEVRPRQVAAVYEKFKYPLTDLEGWVRRTETPGDPPVTAVDLRGKAAGQSVTILGRVTGDGPDPGLNLRLTASNVPLDDALVSALTPRYADLVRRCRATGRGDLVAAITQPAGVNLTANEFRVTVRDGAMCHADFPVRLEKVRGELVVRTTSTDPARPVRPGDPTPPPDRDELVLDKFTAVHAGAAVTLDGKRLTVPGSKDRKLTLRATGVDCPLTADLRTALAGLGVGVAWDRINPRGRATFEADVELTDRAGRPADARPDPAADVRLALRFSGPTVTPTFFPYELTDAAGALVYQDRRLDVSRFAARHGATRVRVAAGEVRFYPDGAVWANLGGVEVTPLVTDAALLKALPPGLSAAVADLKLGGGADLLVKHLVVLDRPAPDPTPAGKVVAQPSSVVPTSAQPRTVVLREGTPVARGQAPASSAARPDPVVYWDAEVRLAGASFDTGVGWEAVTGAVACRGRYEGTHTGRVEGNVWFDRAVVAGLPVTQAGAHLSADPQRPDPARPGEYLPTEVAVTDLRGDLFHGAVGGQARVVLSDPPRFNLALAAADVQLDEVAKHYKLGSDADLKGIAQAELHLYNRPDPKTGRPVVEGSGKVDIPTGRMYNLPVLLDLVKVLKLQAPDKTAFEEAHATFRVRGDRVKVDQVDLIGKAVCLGGSGELDTTGEYVKFDFYTLGSQVLAKMVHTPVGDLTAFLSKNLFVIRLTREDGELRYKPEAVPLVTDPARAVADRLRARAARMFGGGGGR
ncbi:MAG: hypothetical protein C0501_20350 [Isosphaera sp.]|nr:hypothetical protein [Isosphaera sp.]